MIPYIKVYCDDDDIASTVETLKTISPITICKYDVSHHCLGRDN